MADADVVACTPSASAASNVGATLQQKTSGFGGLLLGKCAGFLCVTPGGMFVMHNQKEGFPGGGGVLWHLTMQQNLVMT